MIRNCPIHFNCDQFRKTLNGVFSIDVCIYLEATSLILLINICFHVWGGLCTSNVKLEKTVVPRRGCVILST